MVFALTNRLMLIMNNNTSLYGEINGDNIFREEHVSGGGEYMETWAYSLTALALFFIGFFGFFLNLFVILLMCKDIQVSKSYECA